MSPNMPQLPIKISVNFQTMLPGDQYIITGIIN